MESKSNKMNCLFKRHTCSTQTSTHRLIVFIQHNSTRPPGLLPSGSFHQDANSNYLWISITSGRASRTERLGCLEAMPVTAKPPWIKISHTESYFLPFPRTSALINTGFENRSPLRKCTEDVSGSQFSRWWRSNGLVSVFNYLLW